MSGILKNQIYTMVMVSMLVYIAVKCFCVLSLIISGISYGPVEIGYTFMTTSVAVFSTFFALFAYNSCYVSNLIRYIYIMPSWFDKSERTKLDWIKFRRVVSNVRFSWEDVVLKVTLILNGIIFYIREVNVWEIIRSRPDMIPNDRIMVPEYLFSDNILTYILYVLIPVCLITMIINRNDTFKGLNGIGGRMTRIMLAFIFTELFCKLIMSFFMYRLEMFLML